MLTRPRAHELSVVKSHSYLLYSQSWYFCCVCLFMLISSSTSDLVLGSGTKRLNSLCDHMTHQNTCRGNPVFQVNMSVYGAVYSTSARKKLTAVLALVLQENNYT